MEPQKNLIVPASFNRRGPKQVSEKAKLDVRILSLSLPVLAVDDLGLRRMHLEAALRQSGKKLSLKGLRFLPAPTVNQSIVCVPTPRKVWVRPCHPQPLRGTTRSLNPHTVFLLHWRLQPPFDVE